MSATDVSLMLTIVTLFVIIGAFLPFVEEDFTGTSSDYNVDDLESSIQGNLNSANTTDYSGLGIATKGVNVFVSILSMFFWSFNIPNWLNTLFLIPRIMLAVLFVRWLRGN